MSGARIARVDWLDDGAEVPVYNTSSVNYARDRTGRLWVRKRQSRAGRQVLLAEAVCWLLARRLDVPQPEVAFFDGADDPSWLSECVPEALGWRAELLPRIRNIAALGSMLALDAIALNADRHEENILLRPATGGDFDAIVIDNGNAEVGWPDGFERHADEVPDPKFLVRGLPLQSLLVTALAAAARAAALSHDELLADVREAASLVGVRQVDALARTLHDRCKKAPSLVTLYIGRIGARP